MLIRPFMYTDLESVIDLTIETFRPSFENYVRPLLGEELFQHQHGNWEQDYRDDLPARHDPAMGRYLAVAEDDAIVGIVAWNSPTKPDQGQIYLLAVSSTHRRQGTGRLLCLHAIQQMKAAGIHFVGLGTGDDPFHVPARALYESLGLTKIPTAGYLGKI